MPGNAKVNGTWQELTGVSAKVDGSWQEIAEGYTKVNGTWEQWFTPGGGMTLIEEITLASTQSSIDFTNIPQTFKHLYVVASLRTNRNELVDIPKLQVNNITSSSYRQASNFILNYSSFTLSQLDGQRIAGAQTTSDQYTPFVVDITDYTNTNKKPNLVASTSYINNEEDNRGRSDLRACTVSVTGAVTSLQFFAIEDFVVNTKISLYGLG